VGGGGGTIETQWREGEHSDNGGRDRPIAGKDSRTIRAKRTTKKVGDPCVRKIAGVWRVREVGGFGRGGKKSTSEPNKKPIRS